MVYILLYKSGIRHCGQAAISMGEAVQEPMTMAICGIPFADILDWL